ncbi:MAG: hypothetical protein R3298_11910 [Gammaproteobacteria bacterium]|nr:hypothetical protein [Gammaproteobacteria bacterium]
MSVTVHLTRDSVAAGDDADAPHELALLVPDDATTEAMVAAILDADYLPRIASGRATWSVISDRTLAVIAQQWPEPRMVADASHPPERLLKDGSGYSFHVKYHAQQDPETVLAVLRRVRAPSV